MDKDLTAINEFKPEFIIRQSELATSEQARVFDRLSPILTELRKSNEISGFLLKNSVQAIADLDKPGDLTNLAVLVSQVFETSTCLLVAHAGGQMSYSILEGSKVVVLCLHLVGNQLAIFMEKSSNYAKILEKFVTIEI